MVRPRKLKDMVLSQLDFDPVKAETLYEALSNDELIDLIANTASPDARFSRHDGFFMPEEFNS